MINKTPMKIELDKLLNDYNILLNKHPEWLKATQVCVNSRPNAIDPITDGVGSGVIDGIPRWNETDFTVLNEPFKDTYFEEVCKIVGMTGRIRIMRMMPRSCYSFHSDPDLRYHIALITNPNAYFLEIPSEGKQKFAMMHHIPVDGYVYNFCAKKHHNAINGDLNPRVHLVFCRGETIIY